MIVTRVISIEEAYQSIGWQSVFLLASLIPLGVAVEHTGTALWIAQQFVGLLEGVHTIVYMLAFGILATVFTLVMSQCRCNRPSGANCDQCRASNRFESQPCLR